MGDAQSPCLSDTSCTNTTPVCIAEELLANDNMRFEQERATGNAFVASISAVRKTARGINPKDHRIELEIEHQPKIRLRAGQHVQIIGGVYAGEIPRLRPYVERLPRERKNHGRDQFRDAGRSIPLGRAILGRAVL